MCLTSQNPRREPQVQFASEDRSRPPAGLVDDRGNPYVSTPGGGMGISVPPSFATRMSNPLAVAGSVIPGPAGMALSAINTVGGLLEPDRVIGTLGNARTPLTDYRGITNPNGVPQTQTAMLPGQPTLTPVARAMVGAMPGGGGVGRDISPHAVSAATRANVNAQLARPGGSASSMFAERGQGRDRSGGGPMGNGGRSRPDRDAGRGFR